MKWVWRTIGFVVLLALAAGAAFYLRPVSCNFAWMYLKEDFSGIESHSVQVSGYKIHYLAEGPAGGPVVVLVHGLGGRSEDWRNLAPQLARAGFRIYMPDLVGYGRSEKPAAFSYAVHDEAAIVVGFMDALGLKQVELGGWSMGGWIVQLVATDHPERISRLMLFDSAGLYARPDWDTNLFTPTTAEQLAQLDDLLMPNPPKVPAFLVRDILRVSHKNGWIIQRALSSMLTAQDVTDEKLPGLKMPVLIVWGSLDRITPPDQAEKMHQLMPQSDLEMFAGCGHMAPLECSAQIGPKLVAFAKQ